MWDGSFPSASMVTEHKSCPVYIRKIFVLGRKDKLSKDDFGVCFGFLSYEEAKYIFLDETTHFILPSFHKLGLLESLMISIPDLDVMDGDNSGTLERGISRSTPSCDVMGETLHCAALNS